MLLFNKLEYLVFFASLIVSKTEEQCSDGKIAADPAKKGISSCSQDNAPSVSMKIVSLNGDTLVAMNLNKLREILEKYRDIPLAVISVAGKMRGGKSYLLSHFLQYSEKITLSKGFQYKGGFKKCTTGIDIWPQPHKVNGKDLVVLFMDTQGVFDQEQAVAGEANLIALSFLLSSVQIFNVNRFMDANDKSHLEVYTDLAKEAQQENISGKFQKLIFLIRDFVRTQEIGLDDGAVFLRDGIKPSAKLNDSVEQIECHLLPHPGNAFEEQREGFARDPQFLDFDARIRSFVKRVLDPSRLEPKKFNRSPITCGEFVSLLEVLIKWFNSDDATRVKTPQQAMAETRIYGRLKNCKEMYDERMENEGARTDKITLLANHEETMNLVFEKYAHCSALGSEEIFEASKKKLADYCQRRFEKFAAQLKKKQEEIDNAAKETALVAFEESMNAQIKNIRAVTVFNDLFEKLKTVATANYDSRQVLSDAPTGPILKTKLLDEMLKKYNDLKSLVEEREGQDKMRKNHQKQIQMRNNLQLAKNEYLWVMNNDGKFAEKISTAWDSALRIFDKSPKEPQELYNKYRDELEDFIRDKSEDLRVANNERLAREEEQWQKDKHKIFEIAGSVTKTAVNAVTAFFLGPTAMTKLGDLIKLFH